MKRRRFLGQLAGALAGWSVAAPRLAAQPAGVSVEDLPALRGALTLYLGTGEGGLYENVLQAIEQRNPEFELSIRRGPTAALANAIVAESQAGALQPDLFWAVDSGAIGMIGAHGLARELPADLVMQLKPGFRYPDWAPVTGRIRTIPYHTRKLDAGDIPDDVLALPEAGFRIGWAPSYAAFQSFVTAMRVLEGEAVTADWLRRVREVARPYAGELSVVMGVERGEVDIGFANHYYTLRLKAGKPDANVDLAFTRGDAGCLVNASGILALGDGSLPVDFIRYLLTTEVQSYLASEAYEMPLIEGVPPLPGIPALDRLSPPSVDLTELADLRPTLELMRQTGVL